MAVLTLSKVFSPSRNMMITLRPESASIFSHHHSLRNFDIFRLHCIRMLDFKGLRLGEKCSGMKTEFGSPAPIENRVSIAGTSMPLSMSCWQRRDERQMNQEACWHFAKNASSMLWRDTVSRRWSGGQV